jgi:hypothetical protein
MGLLVVALLIVAVAAPLRFVMARVHRRAVSQSISSTGTLFLTFVGWMLGIVSSWALVAYLYAAYGVQDQWSVIALLTCGSIIGATVGAGVGYSYLWLRTTDDEDLDRLDIG